MSRHLAWFFLTVVTLAMSAPLQALNYEVGGCKTGSGYLNFTTISAAVVGVPAGTTILVCPGTYPEQVTITQPLTLLGIRSGNASRAVIVINPNGNLAPNVTSGVTGAPFYAQVLVQNLSPAGPVDIIGITLDGAGANAGCSSLTLAGIFYASDTSGTVNEVTARNQVNGGCAWGIWVENGGGTNQVITIENSSVHNQGNDGIGNVGIGSGGISAVSVSPPTLSATIRGNFLSNTGGDASDSSAGGDAILSETNGEISENVITSNPQFATSIFASSPSVVVSGNTVANNTSGFGIEIFSGITAGSNKLSNVGYSIVAHSDPATTIKSNTIKNTLCGISFGGGSSGAISGNILNDSVYGFANWSGPPIGGNSLYNIDNVRSTTSNCP
jgi:parallel beta-helix repeat protein